ncbi:MAG: sterol transfer family [Solirubrobacterales bacterium]|jgi:hypothetical protein|nr:sterol transfer family [Solirubrobacterales bacterium]
MASEEQAGARPARRLPRRKRAATTEVRLGRRRSDGVAPSLYVWVERGVERRPRVAAALRGRIVFRFEENLSPLLLNFGDGLIEVSDADLAAPDLTVSGRLPDIVALATAPHVLGVPNPVRPRGLSAILRLSSGRVAIEGDRGLALRLIRLLAL